MTETTANFDSILARVRKLIERADHAGTSETEADACRAKAERLMLQHAIDEEQLDALRPAASRTVPEKTGIEVCDAANPIRQNLCDLVQYIASHCRCQVVFYNLYGKYGRTSAVLVGYPSDLRYVELLFTSVLLHLSGQVEPTPDPLKSFDENVYILHEAGVKWQRIADVMNRAYDNHRYENINDEAAQDRMAVWRKSVRPSKDQPGVLVPWPDGARLKNAYRRHCAKIGEEPRAIVSPATYQRNFAEGYVGRIATRLYNMRKANADIGTALVRRTEDVTAAFNEFFPPELLGEAKKRKETRYDYEAQNAGRRAGDLADLTGGRGGVESKRGELS
jgi:hypothetical protein